MSLGWLSECALFVHNFYTADAAVDFLNVLQISEEITMTKMPEKLRVKSDFKHTLTCLKKLGVPANNSFQV